MTMRIRKCTSLGLCAALFLLGHWGCAPRLAPAIPSGVALQPGRYLTAYYRARDFGASQARYALKTFPVETAQGVGAGSFQTIFMEELTGAWKANGLKVSDQGDTEVGGVVQFVAVRGTGIRFLRGKIDADLLVSASISRGDEILFACQDRFSLSSPINPGPPAPKEAELLLRQAARTFAVHLLNELLLYWPPEEGK